MTTRRFLSSLLWALVLIPGGGAQASTELARCLDAQTLPRVARVVDQAGAPAYVRVLEHAAGVPTVVSPIADGPPDLEEVLTRAAQPAGADAPRWSIAEDERATRICSPLHLPQEAIDAEQRVVVAAGLNYAAHAEEAGGGDVFLFPKPVSPGAPYAPVPRPAGVRLFDYEVELAFVLLGDVDLGALPSRDALLARTAWFVANDLTDREPIIVYKALSGPGTGFVDAKGQPGFMPLGPWLVRGTELFAALEACGETGLGLSLEVDEGQGFVPRQSATTAAMILDPPALLSRIADDVSRNGLRTRMPLRRGQEERFHPLALPGSGSAAPYLPAGSVILTGTPDGIALQAPGLVGLIGRALLNLRGPLEQFRQEELARAAAGEVAGAPSSGYLTPGARVRARIDGLGAQIFPIVEPTQRGGTAQGPCDAGMEIRHDAP